MRDLMYFCVTVFQLYADSDGIPTADEVYAQFKKLYSEDEADEILGSNTDHDDMRKVSCQGSKVKKISSLSIERGLTTCTLSYHCECN